MGYIKSFLYEFKNIYTEEDRIITILFASIFLPWQVTAITVVVCFVYILFRFDVREFITKVFGSRILIGFSIYLYFVALFNQNWLGAILSVGMFLLFGIVLFFRRYIHKNLWEQLLDIAIILSVVSVIYAIFEQIHYMSLFEDMSFFYIQNKPQFRVHTFYFNANYYAMMILFIECMCIYKFFNMKNLKWHIYYVVMGLLNLFALYLTGGRIAWLCLALAVFVMLIINKWYKLFGTAVVAVVGALGVLSLKPNLLPRLASQGLKIGRRTKIWETAILIIKDSPIFGRGPLTYYNVYKSYTPKYIEVYGLKSFKQYKLGISSQHAHTMFLEPIVSFGIVGTIIISVYLGIQIKYFFRMLKRNIDPSLSAFIGGVLVSTIAFCIIDFPIFWLQTGMFFLFAISAFEVYKKELQ